MEKNKKKSSLTFNLKFTTSKLLSYVVLVSSSLLGYLLSSVEVVIVGLIVSAALSGVKNITESLVRLRSGFIPKERYTSNDYNDNSHNDNDTEDDEYSPPDER